jgi:penicillin-binding protein 1A
MREKAARLLKNLKNFGNAILFLREKHLLPHKGNVLANRILTAFWLFPAAIFFISVIFIQSLTHNLFGYFGDIPSMSELEKPKILAASELFTADKTLIGRYFLENRSPVRYNKISPNVVHALLATEDVRFYEHSGVDPQAFFGILISFVGGDKRGGTIS